jgi:glucokinase
MRAIGIDLGGTNIKIALVDQKEGILSKESVLTEADQGRDHVVAKMAGLVKEMAGRSDAPVRGVGLGLPGMVSLDGRIVRHPPNFPGWGDEPIALLLEQQTGLPCILGNDANMAAFGSSRFGVGRAYDHFIMITLGTGVGGGIIYDRKLFLGSTGAAAELGHVIINYHGPLSNSNTRGGIEAYLGQRFLSRFAADMIRQHPGNPLTRFAKQDFETLEPVDLYHEAKSGNDLAVDILRQSGEKLGYAIVNYIHMMDIRTFILSGGVANAGDFLLKPARETALKFMMPPYRNEFEILNETLGNDAAILGSASLAMEAFAS